MARNKFGAKKTICAAGHKHPSRKEAHRCDDLHLLQRAGAIIALKVEPRFYFHANGREVKMRNGQVASYRPDFSYIEGNRLICEDVKGGKATITEASALRMALFRACYPDIDLRLV
jgi:hypothetical protein